MQQTRWMGFSELRTTPDAIRRRSPSSTTWALASPRRPRRALGNSGEPQEIAEQLRSFATLGFTAMNFSPVGPEPERQVGRLAQEVLPMLRRLFV